MKRPAKKKEEAVVLGERGFETLLKPIQEVLAKDWQFKLCVYLNLYLDHVKDPNCQFINFSEAALIVQNSLIYYGKRVDIVYNWVRDFAMSLASYVTSKTPKDNEPEDNNGGGQQKKKSAPKKKALVDEELEYRKLLKPDKNCHMLDDEFEVEDEEVITLNGSVKASSKPGSACMVYQLDKEDMGYKEEFRLHWRISNNGQLHRDFFTGSFNLNNSEVNGEVIDDMEAMEELSDVDMAEDVRDDGHDVSMDFNEVPPPSDDVGNEMEFINNDENLPLHQSNQVTDPPVDVPPQEISDSLEDPWPIPAKSLVIHRKFKWSPVRTRLENKAEKQKRTLKLRKKAPDNEVNCHLSFSEILGGKSEDKVHFQLRKILQERIKRIQDNKKKAVDNNNIESVVDLNNDLVENDDEDNECLNDLNFELDDAPLDDEASKKEEDENNFANAYAKSVEVMQSLHSRGVDSKAQSSQRVARWHEMIRPVIDNAQARSIFDVHEYGTKILEKFDSVGEKKSFAEIATGQPKKEICRYLLSSLMLANTYNVELSKTDPHELSKDCLNLKLLSLVRHHEELDANIGEAAAGALYH